MLDSVNGKVCVPRGCDQEFRGDSSALGRNSVKIFIASVIFSILFSCSIGNNQTHDNVKYESRSCSEKDHTMLDESKRNIEFLDDTPVLFDVKLLNYHIPTTSGCTVVNFRIVIQFDINNSGKVNNLRIIESEPKGRADRAILRAIYKIKYFKNVYGTENNKVSIAYFEYD